MERGGALGVDLRVHQVLQAANFKLLLLLLRSFPSGSRLPCLFAPLVRFSHALHLAWKRDYAASPRLLPPRAVISKSSTSGKNWTLVGKL